MTLRCERGVSETNDVAVTIPVVLIEGLPLKPDAVSALPVTLPVTAPSMGPTKLPAVTELPTEILFVTLAIPAMVIVEPPPTGLILLTFSMFFLF